MKIFVVFDRLYERVLSVHKTEKVADEKLRKLNKESGNDIRQDHYQYTYDKFELEE